jgi:hypothetical protein
VKKQSFLLLKISASKAENLPIRMRIKTRKYSSTGVVRILG